jgi:glycosyltransferase involved in cell wall biosynthesis
VRILHIITGLSAGGAEQQLRLLLRYQGDAEVATLTNPGSLAEAIRSEGTIVHHIGMRANTDAMVLPRLVRLIHARRFDVVHTHLYRACVYGRTAARLARVRPVVATEHSLGDQHIEGRRITPGIRRLYLATERLGSTTIAVSPAVVGRLLAWGVPASRVDLIPNAIEADRYRFDPARRVRVRAQLGIYPDRFVIGSVGRLVPGKRVDVLLRSLSGQVGVTVLVVGEGPERPSLTALARELHVDAVFTGESADVPGLLSAMDVLVAPSEEETFGLAVLEGLAAGLPVFYGACPALDDVPLGSLPAAHRLPTDPDELRRTLGAVVHQTPRRLRPPAVLDKFGLTGIAERTDRVYRRVAAGTSHRQPTPQKEKG